MDLKCWYDPTMFELVRAEVSDEFQGVLHSLHTGTDGLIRMSCASTQQLWCYDLLTLELRVRDGVTGTTQLTAEATDIYDTNRIPYLPGSAQRQVTVAASPEVTIPALLLESEPLVIGAEASSTLILDAGSDLAAADDAYLIINPNYNNGIIRWQPKANANRHFTLESTIIDPVNKDHDRVSIDCPVQTGCIYRTETSQATCTQPGGTALVCISCGSRIPLDSTPALGHGYGVPTFRWSDNYESCTVSRVCARDSSHVWQVNCTVTHVSKGENCAAPGSVTYTATADFYGEIYTDQVTVYRDSLGHDYDWTVITEPGCTTEGLRQGACIRCGTGTVEVMAPLGHNYEAVVTDPTCTESGVTIHTCTRCGDRRQDGHRDPLGHDCSGTVCRRCGETRENPFSDVPEGSFYYAPVIWAVDKGITNGISATAFGPTNSCVRAQVVTFLYRTLNSPAPSTQYNPFVDIPSGTWYTVPVIWAVEQGITNGKTTTEFAPSATCNRAQIVTFLYRAFA